MSLSETRAAAQARPAGRAFYLAAWRWHFYAGLYVAPFLITLAVTGLIMLFTGVIDGRDGEHRYPVQPGTSLTPVSAQMNAALALVPDGEILQYIAPATVTGAAMFRLDAGETSMMMAVDPYRAEVLGSWPRRNGLYDLANEIHGTLMIGTLGDRLIEIAAGFGIVLIVTGLYLWWPRNGTGLLRALRPELGQRGRPLWKSLHMTMGAASALILLVFLLSGLTWAGIWGEKYTQAWSTFPAEKWDAVPLSDKTHATLNHDGVKDVPWTLEQTPLPASGSEAGTPGVPAGTPVDVDGVVALARSLGFQERFQLAFPAGETGVWTISRDTMSNDSANPLSDRTVHVDRYTGNVLADVGFRDYGVAGKTMAVGVAFQEGDRGGWNVVVVAGFCLSILFLSVSGIVLWWKRRPAGVLRFAAPPVPENFGLWKGGAITMLVVACLFPLTGAVLVAVLALDFLLIRRLPVLKRVFS